MKTRSPKTITKNALIAELIAIRDRGWIKNARHGNDGGVGNTLEDALGIEENNLPIPNSREWELKSQRRGTTSLLTLTHLQPSPRAFGIVKNLLLPKYGWPHAEAGKKKPSSEMSFRMTMYATRKTDRGFGLLIDDQNEKIVMSFDQSVVDSRHASWLSKVKKRAGTDELNPQPYWGFKDLEHKLGVKLLNAFFVIASVKMERKQQYYHYDEAYMLQDFSFDKFLEQLRLGHIRAEIDARTGHDHGAKFRIEPKYISALYAKSTRIF